MDYDDKLEKLVCLPIGRIRELLAYANGEETLDSWLEDVNSGILTEYPEDEQYYEEDDEDWTEEDGEDDDSWPEEEDYEDWGIDGEDELPEGEELAHQIASEVYNGMYSLDTVKDLYSYEMVERVKYLMRYK